MRCAAACSSVKTTVVRSRLCWRIACGVFWIPIIGEPITLRMVAEQLRVSEYYLAHVFKQEFGVPPMQYVMKRRIGEAQGILMHTETPIAEIADTLDSAVSVILMRCSKIYRHTARKIPSVVPAEHDPYGGKQESVK